MNITTTLQATLTAEQEINWKEANWGAFTRQGSHKVAQTVIAMLKDGIDAHLITDDYDRLMDIIEERSGVEEVTDSEARDSVLWVLEKVLDGSIPTLRRDFNTDEDEGDA